MRTTCWTGLKAMLLGNCESQTSTNNTSSASLMFSFPAPLVRSFLLKLCGTFALTSKPSLKLTSMSELTLLPTSLLRGSELGFTTTSSPEKSRIDC